jgi:hypothetical protein
MTGHDGHNQSCRYYTVDINWCNERLEADKFRPMEIVEPLVQHIAISPGG